MRRERVSDKIKYEYIAVPPHPECKVLFGKMRRDNRK